MGTPQKIPPVRVAPRHANRGLRRVENGGLTIPDSSYVLYPVVSPVLTNPYEVLGVPRDASSDAIKSAYRKLAMRYHPDRNPGSKQAEERFKEVSEAYAVLRDPDTRARFDRYGTASTAPGGAPDFTGVDWQTIFREADIPINWDVRQGSPRTGNAVFDALFGMMTGLFRNAGLLPGETREIRVSIPLELARAGGQRRVRVPGPSVCPTCHGSRSVNGAVCPDCGGAGVRGGRAEVDVAIPEGVRSGSRLRLKGMGGPGNPPGDLLVRVAVSLPGGARMQGDDVLVDIHVTASEAARGLTTRFAGGAVRVPAGTPDGGRVRVRRGGLGGGDLIVTVHHDLWRGLARAAADWLANLTEGRT